MTRDLSGAPPGASGGSRAVLGVVVVARGPRSRGLLVVLRPPSECLEPWRWEGAKEQEQWAQEQSRGAAGEQTTQGVWPDGQEDAPFLYSAVHEKVTSRARAGQR